MNILYIAPFKQNDGWGLGARDYLRSLLSVKDFNVAACFYPTISISTINDIPEDIQKVDEKKLDKVDIIIQKALVEGAVYATSESVQQHIFLTYLENKNLSIHDSAILKEFSQLWCPCNFNAETLRQYNPKASSISHPIDTENIRRILKDDPKISNNNSFKFYVVGEYIQRKNIKDTVVAFNLEFDPAVDDVQLIIKTSVPGSKNHHEARQQIIQDIRKTKEQMRLKKPDINAEQVLTEKVSFEKLMALHNSCDCFVTSSYGESFCRGAAEALCAGNPVILHNTIGIIDNLDKQDYYEYQTSEDPVMLNQPEQMGSLKIYNAEENWSKPSIASLRKQMRLAYENRRKVDKEKYQEEFSYSNIGKKICQKLQ